MLYLIPSASVFVTLALFLSAYATQGKRCNRPLRIAAGAMAGVTLLLFLLWGIARNF